MAQLRLVQADNDPPKQHVRARDLLDGIVFCKAFRSHRWTEDLTSGRPERRGYTVIVLFCDRCETRRYETLRDATGERQGNLRYEYTPVYRMITPLPGDAWRKEYLRRIKAKRA